MAVFDLIPGAGAIRDSVIGGVGAFVGGALVAAGMLVWAVFSYGPGQYEAGGAAMALDLTAATEAAQKELLSDVEQKRFARVECRKRDPAKWVWDFAADGGKCVKRSAD